MAGFVVLCPPVPASITDEMILAQKKKGTRGTVISTGLDPRVVEQKALIERFARLGLEHRFSFAEKDGHWYPQDLSQRIDEALLHLETGKCP